MFAPCWIKRRLVSDSVEKVCCRADCWVTALRPSAKPSLLVSERQDPVGTHHGAIAGRTTARALPLG